MTAFRFQECSNSTGNNREEEVTFSGEHKLYGYKLEMSVLPNGLAIGCSTHYPGSVADVDIFYKRKSFRSITLEKQEKDGGQPGFGLLEDEHSNMWATLAEKDYQASIEFRRLIHPKKKPKNGHLTIEDETISFDGTREF